MKAWSEGLKVVEGRAPYLQRLEVPCPLVYRARAVYADGFDVDVGVEKVWVASAENQVTMWSHGVKHPMVGRSDKNSIVWIKHLDSRLIALFVRL